MTNKLPEVGKRYNQKWDNKEAIVFDFNGESVFYKYPEDEVDQLYNADIELFSRCFEPLAKEKEDLNRSNNTQLEEAKEELRKAIEKWHTSEEIMFEGEIICKAQNLLDAQKELELRSEEVSQSNGESTWKYFT